MIQWIQLLFGFGIFVTFITPGEAIKCVVCDSQKDGLACFAKPPPAQTCVPIFQHCISVSTFKQDTGEVLSLQRSCSPVSFEDACMPGVDRSRGGALVRMCTRFCSTNGCNKKNYAALLLGNVFDEKMSGRE